MSFYGTLLVMTVLIVSFFTARVIREMGYANSINTDFSTASAVTQIETQQMVIASVPSQMQNYTASISGLRVISLNGTYVILGDNGYIYSVT